MNILNNYTEIKPIKSNSNNIAKSKTTMAKSEYKPDILDKLSEKVVNKKDINDMVTVPRAIFKGYLCFTIGTAINAISGMLKKNGKISKGLTIAGSLMSVYGTFNFVKPFLIKEENLTEKEK